ncbi:MAG: hypothetical protein AMXMBFR64_02540 [Myxococcales bacterium]
MRLLPVLVLALSVHARAAVPDRVPFQGFLATSSGAPASGSYALTIRVFDAQTGGALLYEQPASVAVGGGLFDVELGPLPAAVTAAPSRWVEVQVEAEPPLARRPLLAAAFALQAGRADLATAAETLACSGCVGTALIAPGAIKAAQLGVPWAAGAGPGGDAAGLACSGCVDATDLAAGSVGTAALQDGGVASADVAFTYAGSASKGGPAGDVACTGCIHSADLAANLEVTGSFAADGSTLYVDGLTHRVGVGVGAPASTLHVVGGTFQGTTIDQKGNGPALEVTRSGAGEGPNDPVLRVTELRQGGGSAQPVLGVVGASTSGWFVQVGNPPNGNSSNPTGGGLIVQNTAASTRPTLRLVQGGAAPVIEGGDGSATTFTVAKSGAVAAKALDLGGGSLTSFRAHPASTAPGSCSNANAGQIWFDTANAKFMGCDGTEWVPLSGGSAGPGSSQSLAGRDCVELKELGVQASGIYWIDPNGGTQADAFPAYCEMDTDGGGWTMCYTDNGEVRLQSQTTFTQANPYGTDGYRTACGAVAWSEVLYVNHTANQKAWFKRDIDLDLTFGATGYDSTGGSFGTWSGYGVASASTKYQVMVCDTSGLFGAIMTTGYNGCWKYCNNWCNDGSATYFRTDADSGGSFNGVAFNENGHQTVSTKLMSVGIRRARPFTDAPSNTKDTPAASCLALRNGGTDTDGYYWLDPNGGSAADSFLAWCDMTTDGGGWTMCHTDNAEVHAKTEVTFSMAGAFGFDGYRSDCRNIPFNNVLYVNHDNGQKAWFKRDTAGTIVASSTTWFTNGSTYGLWTGYGSMNGSYKYQLLLCDNGWMWTGFFISGYTSCWKGCNNWCSDGSTPYYRYDGDDGGSYNGVSFNQNGHTNVPYKMMSVGVR